MTDPISIAHAGIALVSLFIGGWFLVNSKSFPNPVHTTLTGATCFATVGYLISRLGFGQAASIEEMVQFESAATGFAILIFGLYPYCLTTERRPHNSPYRVIQAVATVILLFINYDRPISLRFEKFTPTNAVEAPINFTSSGLLWTFVALGISSAIYGLLVAREQRKDESVLNYLILNVVSLSTIIFFLYEIYQFQTGKLSPRVEWIAVSMLMGTAIYWRIAHRKVTAETPHYWFPPAATREKIHPPEPKPSQEETLPEEPDPTFRQAILYQVRERDSEFIAKLLSSRGFSVMNDDGATEVPKSHFEEADTAYAVLFCRDDFDGLPERIRVIRSYEKRNIALYAICKYPDSPQVQQEIKHGFYDKALGLPLKAMELFSLLDSPYSLRSRHSNSHLRDVRG